MPGPHRPAIHETAVRGLRAGEEGVPGSEDALLVDGLEVHASAAWSAPWCRPAGGQEQATGQWPDVANRAEARTPGARGDDRAATGRGRRRAPGAPQGRSARRPTRAAAAAAAPRRRPGP